MSIIGGLIGLGGALLGSRSGPKAPDPQQTAREQFRYGLATDMANRMMTSDAVNPFGSYRQHQTGFRNLMSPDGEMLSIPTYENRQTLSPNSQRAFDTTQALQLGALGGLGGFLGYGGPSANVTHSSDYMPRMPRMTFPMGTNDKGVNYMPGGAVNPFGVDINPPESGRPMRDVTPRESDSDSGGGDDWHSMSRAERWSGPGPKIALPQISFSGGKPSVSGGFGFHGFGRSLGYDPRRDITWDDGTRTNLNPQGGGIAGFLGNLFGVDNDDGITWSGPRMKPSGKVVRVTPRSSSDSGSDSTPFSTRPKSRPSRKTYSGRGKTTPTARPSAKATARATKTYSGRSGTSGTSSRKTGDSLPGAWF